MSVAVVNDAVAVNGGDSSSSRQSQRQRRRVPRVARGEGASSKPGSPRVRKVRSDFGQNSGGFGYGGLAGGSALPGSASYEQVKKAEERRQALELARIRREDAIADAAYRQRQKEEEKARQVRSGGSSEAAGGWRREEEGGRRKVDGRNIAETYSPSSLFVSESAP